ncbi:MAG: hypothetical protein AB7I08_12220 [Thermoleophilia bacterium]
MPDDLDDLIRAAGAGLEPDRDVTARALARSLAARGQGRVGLFGRLLRSRRGRMGSVAVAVVLAGGVAAAAGVRVIGTGPSGPPWTPAPQNCYALDGYELDLPPLRDAVHLDGAGRATLLWVDGEGIVTAAGQEPGATGWGDPRPLSDAARRPPRAVALAGNERGDLVAAWVRDERVQVAMRPAGEGWRPPEVVSPAGRLVLLHDQPSVAVGPSGEAMVGWTSVPEAAVERQGDGYAIRGEGPRAEVAVRSAGGDWTPPQVLKLGDQFLTQAPALAVDVRGVPVAAVTAGIGGVLVAELDPADGRVRPATQRRLALPPLPRAIGGGASFAGPWLAAGADGHVAVVWSSNGIVTAAVRSGGRWARPVRLSKGGSDANDPRIAVGRGGRMVAAWAAVTERPRPGRPRFRARTVEASVRGADGRWEGPTVISGRGQTVVGAARAAIDGDGTATVVWSLGANAASGRDSRVVSATRPADAPTWPPVRAVSEGGFGPLFPEIAAAPDGRAVAAWSRCRGRDAAEVRAADRPPGAPQWSVPQVVGGP